MANFPGGGRSSTTWILIALILLLSVATLANLYLLIDTRQNAGAPAEEQAEDAPPEEPPSFVKVGPMTVNLQSDEFGNRLLYVGVSLRVTDDRTVELLEQNMPEIHSRLLVLFSSQSAEKLTSSGGKEKLKQEIIDLLAEPMDETLPPLDIRGVLYTDFIVQ